MHKIKSVMLLWPPTLVHQQMVVNVAFLPNFARPSVNEEGPGCLFGVICFQLEEISCKQSSCATWNKENNNGNHGKIAAFGTEELSRGWNKFTAVTCTEWHEKHFGVTVILVVTKRDHYLQCSEWTTFRESR